MLNDCDKKHFEIKWHHCNHLHTIVTIVNYTKISCKIYLKCVHICLIHSFEPIPSTISSEFPPHQPLIEHASQLGGPRSTPGQEHVDSSLLRRCDLAAVLSSAIDIVWSRASTFASFVNSCLVWSIPASFCSSTCSVEILDCVWTNITLSSMSPLGETSIFWQKTPTIQVDAMSFWNMTLN